MFFYQALIMGAVVLAVFLILFVIKVKNRVVLAVWMLLLAVAGAGALCGVQNIFNPRLYTQPVDVSMLRQMVFTPAQRGNIPALFPDYTALTADNGLGYLHAVTKTYHISGNGASSTVRVIVYQFPSKTAADEYLEVSQRFYNSKNYLPADSGRSERVSSAEHKYITSYIKSLYPNYADLIYVPSKIVYYSDVVVQDGNVMVDINEQSNKTAINKTQVISEILTRIRQG